MKETKPLVVTHTIQQHWDKMTDEDKVHHTLSGSEFYYRVQNGKRLAQQVQELNANSDDPDIVLPDFTYTPGEEHR
jgi:hypothetical protein